MYKKYTLDNKVRVILAPLQDTKTVTVLVAFSVGSRYEHEKISGISHFIEHMMFKGTAKRPTTLTISKELDSVGADYNAYTGKDITGYHIKISKEHLPLALDMVSDMLFHSKFDAEEIAREKGVICEEIHMYQDNPLMYVDNLLEQEMFAPSNLGWDIAGTDDTVNGISREDMMTYMKDHYEPGSIVVGVSGNYEEEALIAMVKTYFGHHWEPKERVPFEKYIAPESASVGVRSIAQNKDTEQVQLALGFPAYPYLHPDMPALTLLGVILGGNMSSRLFINIRERLGLCYYIRAQHQPYQDTGNFYIQAGLAKDRIKEAITAVCQELKDYKETGVTDEELKNAKDFLQGKMALQLEDSESVISWYVSQEVMTGVTLTPEEKLEKLYKVTKEDVMRVANDILRGDKATLAIIGPYADAKEFAELVKL